jgi:N-acyl-D-amino-acid deacylase
MLDKIIRGGTIIDGTAQRAYRADVGITGNRIEAIGNLADAEAGEALDATGLCVSPGFIDMHSHSDLTLIEDPRGLSKVHQGVTTEVVGQCGFSVFPLAGRYAELPQTTRETAFTAHLDRVGWTDLAGYARRVAEKGSSINIVPLVGHVPVRAAVMGYEDRPPTDDELEQMRRLVAGMLEQGAFGLSTGLTLVPSAYADQDEVIELAKVTATYGGIYDTHGRFWSDWHFKAAQEAAEIGLQAGLPVQIAHMAIIDPRHQSQPDQLVAVLEQANARGADVTYDVYPYIASGTPLSQFLPGWAQEGGVEQLVARIRDSQTHARIAEEMDKGWFRGIPWDWATYYVASPGEKGDPAWTGRHVAEIADEWRVHPKEAFLRLIDISEDGIFSVVFNRTEEDMQYLLKHPLSLIGSDGNAVDAHGRLSRANVHPRFYGAFPRVLGRYVRDLGVLTLEEAVHKMTAKAAGRLGLRDRGRVAPGYIADLTLFDADTVSDRATFEQPHQYAAGIPHVMVNGQWVLRDNEHTGVFPTGVIIR